MNWTTALPFLDLAGFIVLGVGLFWTQWKTGSNNGVHVATEVIDAYKTQVEQLREELAIEKKGRQDDKHDLKNQIQTLGLKLAHLEGVNEQKDLKIKEFTDLFQGRNPETEQYMKDMRVFAAGVAQYMKDSAEVFAGMKQFMTQLNDKANANQVRNEKIDNRRGVK